MNMSMFRGDFRNNITEISIIKVLTFLSNHSLAQQDSILQTLHEVVPDPFAGHILNPQPQLFFLLVVVLTCKLAVGWNTGQRSNIRLDFFYIQCCYRTTADLNPTNSP